MSPNPKPVTWKSEKYLKFVRNRGCLICGWDAEAHHVRKASNSGVGIKPSDTWCIPLCKLHHAELHHFGFDSFLRNHNINLYKELFLITSSWIKQGAG